MPENFSLTIGTAPAVEPISTTEAKSHLRVDISDDDTLIDSLVKAARERVETITRRALINQTWQFVMDKFPGEDEIELPLPPLSSVTSVVYTDADDSDATFSSASYWVDTDREPGRIKLKSGQSWPSTTLKTAAGVTITFVAGYGAAGSSVPQSIRQAILLLTAHYYENREAVQFTSGGSLQVLPMGVKALLADHRVLRWL